MRTGLLHGLLDAAQLLFDAVERLLADVVLDAACVCAGGLLVDADGHKQAGEDKMALICALSSTVT